MEKLIANAGLQHLADHIFGYVDNYTLAQCMLVCKDWNHFLSRTILVRHFDKLLTLQRWYKTNDEFECHFCLRLSSDWNEAANYFRQICSDEDLKEVIRVLSEWFYKSYYCYCPLEHAASQGYEDFFRVILKTSIDLNKGGTDLKIESPHPAIFNACYYDQINIVKMLLNAKENGTKIDIYGWYNEQHKTSILCEAIRSCNPELVELVLEKSKSIGLDINFNLGPEDQPFSVLHMACGYKIHATEIVRLILDHAKKNDIVIKLFPRFLHGVVTSISDLGILKLLLDRYDEIGLDLNEKGRDGTSVFAEACRCNQPEILCILLYFAHKRGINVNEPDLDGNDFLQYAVTYGNEEVVKAVLKRSEQIPIELNHKNHHGETTLFSACKHLTENLQLFLDFAKEKQIQLQIYGYNNLNQSILQAKIPLGKFSLKHIEIMNVLIARRKEIGLDLYHKDDNGLTASNLLALSNSELVDEKVVQHSVNLGPTRRGKQGCPNCQGVEKRCTIL